VKGFSALFGSVLAISTSLCFAADLKFEDFKVAEVFSGQNHALLPVENSSREKGTDLFDGFSGGYS
jgi:hypothetical protein